MARAIGLAAAYLRLVRSQGHAEEQMNAKRKAVLDRIESLEQALVRAREYLESGKHAQWTGFRPLFVPKLRGGKELPPHKDWVKNVFLPRTEKALRSAEKLADRLDEGVASSNAI